MSNVAFCSMLSYKNGSCLCLSSLFRQNWFLLRVAFLRFYNLLPKLWYHSFPNSVVKMPITISQSTVWHLYHLLHQTNSSKPKMLDSLCCESGIKKQPCVFQKIKLRKVWSLPHTLSRMSAWQTVINIVATFLVDWISAWLVKMFECVRLWPQVHAAELVSLPSFSKTE